MASKKVYTFSMQYAGDKSKRVYFDYRDFSSKKAAQDALAAECDSSSNVIPGEVMTRQAAAVLQLREWIKPGDTLHLVLRHVSKSGMSRNISVFKIDKNEPHNVSAWVAYALDWPVDRDSRSVKVGGAGMDMGFHLVYTLARVLFPAPKGVDGGYSLKERWL